MFETTDYAEIAIPDALKSAGERAWAYVFRRLHVCWFHVVYAAGIDGGTIAQLLFLTDVDQLTDLDRQGNGTILETQIVLPRHLTGANQWTMAPLAEIWAGNEPEAPTQIAYVYVLHDGEHYVDSRLGTPEARLLDRRRIFQAQHKTRGNLDVKRRV